jgi:hypothetical protein
LARVELVDSVPTSARQHETPRGISRAFIIAAWCNGVLCHGSSSRRDRKVRLLAAPASLRIVAIAVITLVSLGALGLLGGRFSGASVGRATLRVTAGGVLAMAITAGVGRLLGIAGV